MLSRCYLFVPASQPGKLEKARGIVVDALILDLEDSVTAEKKEEARRNAAGFLSRPTGRARRFVRVNGFGTGLTERDVAATVGHDPDGYVLPKCESRKDIDRLAGLIADLGGRPDMRILAIATETARAVRNLMREDWGHPRLMGMAWGGEDLAADIGALRNRDDDGAYLDTFRFARNAMLFAAKDAGVEAIDAVHVDIGNDAALEAEARAGFEVGFSGKMAIHPAQVPIIQAAFTPSQDQIEQAKRVVRAFAESGAGAARFDGRMIDLPHLRNARRILSLQASSDL